MSTDRRTALAGRAGSLAGLFDSDTSMLALVRDHAARRCTSPTLACAA